MLLDGVRENSLDAVIKQSSFKRDTATVETNEDLRESLLGIER